MNQREVPVGSPGGTASTDARRATALMLVAVVTGVLGLALMLVDAVLDDGPLVLLYVALVLGVVAAAAGLAAQLLSESSMQRFAIISAAVAGGVTVLLAMSQIL